MFWYVVFAIAYLIVLAALLVFIASASKFAKHSEAEDRMRPHGKAKARLHIRKDYRDAA